MRMKTGLGVKKDFSALSFAFDERSHKNSESFLCALQSNVQFKVSKIA